MNQAKSPSDATIRLDQLLVERNLFPSRSRARDAVERGTVRVDGRVAEKAGLNVSPQVAIEIDDPAQAYVSRAALKLVAGLDGFKLDPRDRICLDIGASTGGFTQVLLERGAAHVVAVDVGHGQMHPTISDDPRVTAIEGLNARHLTRDDINGAAIDFVVSDVSFISLRLAAAPALDLVPSGGHCMLLVKPQFETNPQAIGKGGLLKDPEQGPEIARTLEGWLVEEMGWESLGLLPSPIAGGDGNHEFLLGGRKP